MSIYRSAVNKPVTTSLIFIAFLIFGIFSVANTSLALMPDFDANYVMVMSSYPGANASDVESNLTKVLENTLNGTEGLKDMTSNSRDNISIVNLEFHYGTDIDEAMNHVRDKLDMISAQIPDGASQPMLMKFGMDDLPIMILSATADESLPGLDKILDEHFTTPLARVDGIGTITVYGAPTREIQVYCDPDKLQAYGLSIAGISATLAYENQNIPSGNIDIGTDNYSLRIESEYDDPSQMLDIVVGHYEGNAVYLRDVARIVDGDAEHEMQAYTDGERSASIYITKQTGANTVQVINDVKAMLPSLQAQLPSDVQIKIVIDSSRNIINSLKSLLNTIIITFFVVGLIVFLFLGRWRATTIILISIPISLMASLVYLYATGNSLNFISMAALSIAIGMVVDDSIVVLENITTHIERGEKPKEAAVNGTSEVGISVMASTLTMLCVFFPLTMVGGMAGIMFESLGWIVSIIMIVSVLCALTLVPMLSSRMLGRQKKAGKVYKAIFGPVNRFLDWISRGYAHVIHWATKRRKTVIIGAALVFFGVVILFGPMVQTDFFPHTDQGRLSITMELPVGTREEVTGDVAKRYYERLIKDIPEIQRCNYTFGQADADNAVANIRSTGNYIANYNIDLGSKNDRKRGASELAEIARVDALDFPEIKKITVTEGMGGMGGASSVEAEIYGYDFQTTERIANEIKNKMMESPLFVQAEVSRDEYTPEYQVDFDRTKLALNGLNSTTAASAFSAAMSGATSSVYREEGDEYDIVVRYDKSHRQSVEDIENVIIYNAAGEGVRIKDLGTVIETEVPPTIERKNRQRYITVTGIMADGKSLSSGVEAVSQFFNEVEMPTTVSAAIAGDYDDQQEMFGSLFTLLILIIILVYMVMAAQFESFIDPFVIMFSIPFGFVGVILGFVISGVTLSAVALVGVLILMGIVVKNGIVLIDYTKLMRERGMSVLDASVTAAKSRLRPILMTTLTTVLGMVPMAVDNGEGAELWQPLGITVAWGLAVSTVVTLVLIPTIYCAFETRREKRQARKAAALNQATREKFKA
jgi:HAE1 family hydrophobic/amphiphilic exporter-1